MRRKVIIYLCLSVYSLFYSPIIAQDACEDAFEVIIKLHEAKRWKDTKVECESYLRNCGSRAQVEQILTECEKKLEKTKKIPNTAKPKVVENKRFIVTPLNIEFPYMGGEKLVSIKAEGKWDIYEAPGWVDFEISDNNMTLICGTNYHASAREEEIVLKDEYNNEAHINVFQDKNPDYLRLSANRIDEQDAHGGTYTINVNSNKSWHINSCPRWCKVEKISQTEMEVSLERNYDGYERKGEIEVVALSHGVNMRSVISIRQAKLEHYLLLSNQFFEDNIGNGSKSVPINVETDLGHYRIENIPTWCKIEDQNKTSFAVRILKNCGGGARSAQFKVVAGGQSKIFLISQVARLQYIDVDPSEPIKATKRGGYMIYTVETNCGPWRVVNLPDWCLLAEETNNSFRVDIQPNDGAPRSATFSVSASGERCKLTIKQE